MEATVRIFENYNPYKENLLSKGVVSGVGTAFPPQVFTQQEIKKIFGLQNRVVNKLMDSGHIERRHLYLDKIDPQTGQLLEESPAELREKFIKGIRDIGVTAALNALKNSQTKINEVTQLIAVTSTGFLVPGVSSILARELGLKDSLHRLDIVGMGCNAGMSALYSAVQSIQSNVDQITLVVCVEINSASYVKDETIRTGIVNSLFGDGAAALVLKGKNAFQQEMAANGEFSGITPKFVIKGFESFTIAEQHGAMRFDYDEVQNKNSFFLSKDIPFVIGENMKHPVNRLLKRMKLTKGEISHYIMHTGGGAVIEGAKKSIGLNDYDVRHTTSVLRDYGNISSGSFLVSLERLYAEKAVNAGELGLLIAMGPGATIEVALIEFLAGTGL